MSTSEDIINKDIASLIKEPERDFKAHPLTQPEVIAVIETLIKEATKPTVEPEAAQYFYEVVQFLKTKLLYV